MNQGNILFADGHA
ncbi:MAG: hypothetical protein LBG65_00400 [Puniceicoccales bacterium]|nr:hypothetical protein [Puniceicoccales bacterium]